MHAVVSTPEDVRPPTGTVALRQLRLLRFSLQAPGGAQRDAAEDYIRSRFAGRHGARVTHFLPNLITLGNGDRYCGAVGLATASRGPLFAETYLDAPIEYVHSDEIPVPFNHYLEEAMMPSVDRIVAATKEVCYR